ncbi:AAA family ATPase [Kitasatospora azatica]|uniref:AAA family ATPase n=1 Tax=Kitasatospora azatica TaxID=58347 RepID=UPI0012FBA734
MDARPAAEGPVAGLPPCPEPFAGRTAELAALRAQAARPAGPACRVLVVAGRPGSGRTALARCFARTLSAEHQVLATHLAAPTAPPTPPAPSPAACSRCSAWTPARCRRTGRRPRIRPAPTCAPRSPAAPPCCCSTTSPTPTTCARCCPPNRAAWWWPSPPGR